MSYIRKQDESMFIQPGFSNVQYVMTPFTDITFAHYVVMHKYLCGNQKWQLLHKNDATIDHCLGILNVGHHDIYCQ